MQIMKGNLASPPMASATARFVSSVIGSNIREAPNAGNIEILGNRHHDVF
jgi:hypothetical protein